MIDGVVAECSVPGSDIDPVDKPVAEMIGFLCTSPKDYAAAKSHHTILHREINKQKGN